MRRVAETSMSDFAMLLYPRAPEHDAAIALRVARTAYGTMADRYGIGSVLPIGTSAGGGLAIALWRRCAMRVVELHRVQCCCRRLST
jgi:acetyl esterase/lipase